MKLDEVAKALGYIDAEHLEMNIEAYGEPLDKWWDVMQKVVNKLPLHGVVVSEERAELCDNPNCDDGIVDRDYYGHPIYCQMCESHN